MDIGRPIRVVVVEPVESPIPHEKSPEPEPVEAPEREPERVGA